MLYFFLFWKSAVSYSIEKREERIIFISIQLLKLISVVLEVGNVEILKVNASNKSKICLPCISLTWERNIYVDHVPPCLQEGNWQFGAGKMVVKWTFILQLLHRNLGVIQWKIAFILNLNFSQVNRNNNQFWQTRMSAKPRSKENNFSCHVRITVSQEQLS